MAGIPTGFLTRQAPRFPSDLQLPPPSTFQTMSPPNPKLLSDPQGTAVPSASVSWNPAEAPSSPGWPGQGAGQMGQDTHCQPGSRFWTGRRGCKCGSWSCAGRPVFSCPSPATPPPHRLHPFTDRHPVGRGARSGQRRPLSPGLKQPALCPLLQPWMPPPRRGPNGRAQEEGRWERSWEEGTLRGLLDSSSHAPPSPPSNNGCAAGQRGGVCT